MAGYIGSKSSVTQVDGYTEAEADAEFVNDPNGAITVDGSNVGIGTSSPSRQLHLSSSTPIIRLTDTDTNAYGEISSSSSDGNLMFFADQGNTQANTTIRFYVDTTERMRIDSSGNVLVGTTSTHSTLATTSTLDGFAVGANSFTTIANDGRCLVLNRRSTDGNLLEFNKNGTTVGSIGYFAHGLQLQGESGHSGISFAGNSWIPLDDGDRTDDLISLGLPSYRFDDAFITDGVTTGSDENDKNGIAVLTDTEMLVAARLSRTFRTYKWNKAVASKGDNARTHTGTIAQEVQAAFTAEGLDAGDYAMFMSDTWWEHDVAVPAVEAVEAVEEVTDEDGNVTTEAVEAVEAVDAYTRTDNYDTEAEAPEGATSKTRMGIRYTELLSFVAAYNEQRFASIEARLTALEA